MDSMERIYSMHAKTVYGFLLTRTGNPDTAEELTQEIGRASCRERV